MKTWEKIIVIGFVILNSISGLQISGISVNAVFVGLFTVFAGVEFLKHKNKGGMKIPRASGFLLFILCSMVSCLFSMAYDFRVEHYDIVKSYLINSTFYLVIFVLLFNCTNKYLSECTDCYVNGIVWAARIQAIWGILQLILQYGAGININQILFVDILHSTNTRDWIMGFFSGNSWNMRITGLNFENSMFALVVCLGAALEKKKVWKFLLLATAVLSLSRTGWVMVAGYVIIVIIRKLKSNLKIKKSALVRNAIGGVTIIVASLAAYLKIPSIRRQVSNILLRITDTGAINVSGMRHLLYYPYGFEIWLTRSNIFQMLFGYGMRCSGAAFSEQQDICRIIGIQQYSSAWAVECDVIGLLLGGGVCTLLAYYYEVVKCMKTKFKDAMIIIIFGGITYHYHSISYVIFLLMMASLSKVKKFD